MDERNGAVGASSFGRTIGRDIVKRFSVLLTVLIAATAVSATRADAGVSCHRINASGIGEGAAPEPGDPPNLVRTVAEISGGGLLQGSTDAAFVITDPTPPEFAFNGELTFTTNRATLTVELVGDLNVVTGDFSASGPVISSTGKLAGASGTLAFDGVQDLADPAGSFTETVRGEICVDLGSNGSRT